MKSSPKKRRHSIPKIGFLLLLSASTGLLSLRAPAADLDAFLWVQIIGEIPDGTVITPGVGEFPIIGGGGTSTGDPGDITFIGPNVISGGVFNDPENSGNEGEFLGQQGIVVELYNDLNNNGLVDDAQAPIARTLTDPEGAYVFTQVPDGNILVVEIDPPGASSTDDAQGSGTDSVAALQLTGQQLWRGVNFVDTNVATASIRGSVLADADDSGTPTEADAPHPGLSTTLHVDVNANGSVDPTDLLMLTTTTDAFGEYRFDALPNGHYVITNQETDTASGIWDTDGNSSNDWNAIAVNLSGTDSPSNDFLNDTAVVSGFVRNYAPASNLANTWGVDGLVGVTLRLYSTTSSDADFDPASAPLVASTSSLQDGRFTFAGLADGSYVLVEEPPTTVPGTVASPFGPVASPVGTYGSTAPIAIQITQGSSVNNVSFLHTNVPGSLVGGSVRHDTDGDGDLSAPDPGLAGALLTLHTDPDGDGDPTDGRKLLRTATSLGGAYAIPHVVAGDYVVVWENPESGTTNDRDNSPLQTPGTDNKVAINLLTTNITDIDFLTSQPGWSIQGGILTDTRNNDIIDPADSPICATPITLTRDTNLNGMADTGEPVLGTTCSKVDGSYIFEGLVNGSYVVTEADPVGTTSENDTDGAPADNTIGVVVSDAPALGNVFLDDGFQARTIWGSVVLGDMHLSGVTITLHTAAGHLIDTTETNSYGTFSFTNLPDGTYTLTETNPPGTTGGSDTDGGDPDVITVVLDGNNSQTSRFVDHGVTFASITGRVMEEANWNSAIDEGDTPIAGTRIILGHDSNGNGSIDADDTVIAETRTGWDGTYSFHDLLDGHYLVRSINAGGYSLADADGPDNGSDLIEVHLVGGQDSHHNDFLDQSITLRAISGSVSDGNHPIPGVTITLTTPTGDFIEATTTDDAGHYSFPNLPNGSYLVHETDPVGTINPSDSDAAVIGGNSLAVTISYSNQEECNFVITLSEGALHAITGGVIDDSNGNGAAQDHEDRPLDNHEVSLYRDADGNGIPDGNERVTTTRTTDTGGFTFSGLPDGPYFVVSSTADSWQGTPTGTSAPGDAHPDIIPVSVDGGNATGNYFAVAIDPAGYFYDSATGRIISGGHIEVVSQTFGTSTIVQSGVNGQYSFTVDSADTYTIVVTPPPGYFLDATRPVTATSYDPTGMPDPVVLGSTENSASPGYLVNSTAAANPYYLTFELAPGDPLVLSNNIPLRTNATRSFPQFIADQGIPGGPDAQPVPDQSGNGGNPDRDIHSNLLEYALAEDPFSGASPNQGGFHLDLVDQTSGRVDLTFTRRSDTGDLIFTIQFKSSLTDEWQTLLSIPAGAETPAPCVITPADNGTETIVYPDISHAAQLTPDLGFVRLTVSLDEDRDGSPDALADGTSVTDHTKTFGWQCTHYRTSQTASFSHPFSNAPVFSGTIDYAGSSVLDISTSSHNYDLSQIIGTGGSHYLQITSGPLEGQRFDISRTKIIKLALVNDPDIFSDSDGITSLNTSSGTPTNADLAGQSFVVIPHLTVDQLFDKNAAFAGQASGIPSQAAKVFFYNNRSDSPGLESLILVDLGTEQRWIRSNDLAQLTDQGAMPIDRCSGAYIHPGLGPIGSQFAIGMVADHDLAAAFNSGYNLAGAPYPLDQTPTGTNGRAMTVANGFGGSTNPTQASELLFWTGDQSADQDATYVQGYDSYMQLNGGGMQQWIDVSDQQLNDQGLTLLLESHRAPTVKIPSGTRIEPHVYPAPVQP